MALKICLSLLSRLMYITSLSVDDCEYYSTVSSVAHRRCRTELNFVTLQLKKAKYGLPSLLYGYKTSLSV